MEKKKKKKKKKNIQIKNDQRKEAGNREMNHVSTGFRNEENIFGFKFS